MLRRIKLAWKILRYGPPWWAPTDDVTQAVAAERPPPDPPTPEREPTPLEAAIIRCKVMSCTNQSNDPVEATRRQIAYAGAKRECIELWAKAGLPGLPPIY